MPPNTASLVKQCNGDVTQLAAEPVRCTCAGFPPLSKMREVIVMQSDLQALEVGGEGAYAYVRVRDV